MTIARLQDPFHKDKEVEEVLLIRVGESLLHLASHVARTHKSMIHKRSPPIRRRLPVQLIQCSTGLGEQTFTVTTSDSNPNTFLIVVYA